MIFIRFVIGAASAHFHILSDESRKYFNNAILSSGTALSNWAMNAQADHLSLAYSLADDFGHENCTGINQFPKNSSAQ